MDNLRPEVIRGNIPKVIRLNIITLLYKGFRVPRITLGICQRITSGLKLSVIIIIMIDIHNMNNNLNIKQ